MVSDLPVSEGRQAGETVLVHCKESCVIREYKRKYIYKQWHVPDQRAAFRKTCA
jgi:hypothetical protein